MALGIRLIKLAGYFDKNGNHKLADLFDNAAIRVAVGSPAPPWQKDPWNQSAAPAAQQSDSSLAVAKPAVTPTQSTTQKAGPGPVAQPGDLAVKAPELPAGVSRNQTQDMPYEQGIRSKYNQNPNTNKDWGAVNTSIYGKTPEKMNFYEYRQKYQDGTLTQEEVSQNPKFSSWSTGLDKYMDWGTKNGLNPQQVEQHAIDHGQSPQFINMLRFEVAKQNPTTPTTTPTADTGADTTTPAAPPAAAQTGATQPNSPKHPLNANMQGSIYPYSSEANDNFMPLDLNKIPTNPVDKKGITKWLTQDLRGNAQKSNGIVDLLDRGVNINWINGIVNDKRLMQQALHWQQMRGRS